MQGLPGKKIRHIRGVRSGDLIYMCPPTVFLVLRGGGHTTVR